MKRNCIKCSSGDEPLHVITSHLIAISNSFLTTVAAD